MRSPGPIPPVAPVEQTVAPSSDREVRHADYARREDDTPSAAAEVIALFGPTGVGKTAVAIALARRCAPAARTRSRSPPTRCRSTRVWRSSTGAATPRSERELEHRLLSFVPLTDGSAPGATRSLRTREIDTLLDAGRRPIVVGGTGLYLRAALTELAAPPPAEVSASAGGGARARRARRAARTPGRARPVGGRAAAPTAAAHRARARAARRAASSGPPGRTESSCGPPTRAIRRCSPDWRWIAPRSTPDRGAGRRDGRGRAPARRARAARRGASPTARKALGFDDLLPATSNR